MPLVLQIRDLALLYYTWQNRYLAQRQYRQKFWSICSQAAVARRLIELREEKLLKTHDLPWMRDRILYSVTLAGTRALLNAGFTDIRVGDCPKPVDDFTPGMKHDLDLVDLRIACEETGHIVRWTSEHELRLARKQGRYFARITDGAFTYQAEHGKAQGLFEYERMGYRRTKFHNILLRLKISWEHQDGYTTFFVCREPGRAETLRRWALEMSTWCLTLDQIYFSHYEAVKAAGLAGGFRNLFGRPLGLARLAA